MAGFGQFNYQLLLQYAKLEHDFNFTILATKNRTPKDILSSFKVKEYMGFQRYKHFRIRKKYDLWHSVNQNTKIEPYHNIPYVLTIHDVTFRAKAEQGAVVDYENEHIFLAKLKRANAITYISKFAKDSAHYYYDIPKVPEHIIYNGNPVTALSDTSIFAPKQVPNKPFLFSIGQVFPMKNFQSLPGLLSLLKDYEIIIAGKTDTDFTPEVLAAIKKHNVQDRFHLIGRISEEEKHWYYDHCAAFVFPSLQEGFGLPPIEAMAYGKPVFMSDKTALPEIGGDVAFYWRSFEPEQMFKVFENGMNIFLQDPKKYAHKLKAQAAKFDWGKTAKAYLQVYEEVLAANP